MKRTSPAFPRNREPILEVLRAVFPTAGDVLEVGAGSGQHAAFFAAAFPGVRWFPTDADPSALASIEAWRAESPTLQAPATLDLAVGGWPEGPFDAMLAVNVLHASPAEATPGLLQGAAERLRPGAPLVIYGAWSEDGVAEPSNRAFDAELKGRDPRFGIRDLGDVRALAHAQGLVWEAMHRVPANNRIVVLRRPLTGTNSGHSPE